MPLTSISIYNLLESVQDLRELWLGSRGLIIWLAMFITKAERDSRLRSSGSVLERFGQKADTTQPAKPAPVKEEKSVPAKKTRTLTELEQANRGRDEAAQKQALKTMEGKATVGAVANVFGPIVAQRMFGLSKHQVERIQGAVITRDYVDQTDEDLKKAISEQTNEIRNLAFDRVVAILGCITPEKIQELASKDTKDIAFVAEKLAKIFERSIPKESASPQHVHFHIMKPETKERKEYPVITVGSPIEDTNGNSVDAGY